MAGPPEWVGDMGWCGLLLSDALSTQGGVLLTCPGSSGRGCTWCVPKGGPGSPRPTPTMSKPSVVAAECCVWLCRVPQACDVTCPGAMSLFGAVCQVAMGGPHEAYFLSPARSVTCLVLRRLGSLGTTPTLAIGGGKADQGFLHSQKCRHH